MSETVYKIILQDGTEELYESWDEAFDRWVDVDCVLSAVTAGENSVFSVSMVKE